MAKLSKSFRKQAEKAERTARRMRDPELAAEFQTLATAYRSQADTLKQKKLNKKRREGS